MSYVGRFAPSPTGPLHQGSLVAAMASYLDARAHEGRWLLRIEDIDPPREQPGASADIIETLDRLGFRWSAPVEFQSRRTAKYEAAFERLLSAGHAYGCGCSRKEIGDRPYPGTCRDGLPPGRPVRAWRVLTRGETIEWTDRRRGVRQEHVETAVGDFVVLRADGLWAYQLAVVVDDGDQGITDVVRGDDLFDSTARQVLLQRLLGLPRPRYLHVPVVRAADGQKLSKQTGAAAIDLAAPLEALDRAAAHLGLPRLAARTLDAFWRDATHAWRERAAA